MNSFLRGGSMETVKVKIEGITPPRMIVLVFLFLLTVSCGSSQKYWTKPNFNQTEFDKDNQECILEGQKQAPVESPRSSIQAYTKSNTARITTTDDCMRSRGYTLTDKPAP